MKLFTNKTFENEYVIDILDLIYKVAVGGVDDGNLKFSKYISYDEFKDKFCKFIKSIMELLLKDTEYKDDKCFADILEKLPGCDGLFLESKNKNVILIKDTIIKKIYNGNLEGFLTILHELNHFYIKYSILLGEINEDIARIVKERLIRSSSGDPLEENAPNYYYESNYHLFSEEIYADMCARKDFMEMFMILLKNEETKKELKEFWIEFFTKETDRDNKRYNNHIRDLTTNLNFNDMYLSFEETFEHLIQDNHEWLDIPQIALEYCLDNGVVRKRNTKELEDLLNSSTNDQEQEYLKILIDKFKETNRTLS